MSVGPQTEAVFIQENQSKQQDDSHSALFFLFQEVSKLASPISNSFLDINVPSKWLNETSANNHFRIKKEEEDAHSVRASFSSCQQNLSLPYHHINTMRDDVCNSEATALDEQRCECNSPWKVLSLINRHCEKLLHQRDDDDLGSGVLSSSTKFGRSAAALVAAAADVAEGGVRGDNVECTLRPSLPLCERQESKASISPMETVRECSAGGGYILQGCVKGGCSVRPHTAEKTDFMIAELQEKNSLLRRSQECKDCSPTEKDVLDLPLHEPALHQTHIPNTCLNTQLTISSDDQPTLTLDHNANISLFTDQCKTQPPPLLSSQSASLTAGSSHSPSKDDDIFTASKASRTGAPVKDKSPPAAQLKSSSCDLSSAAPEPELCTAKKEETGLPPAHQWKTKTPRKQPHPSRSADIQDPEFQGVTFRMDTELDDTKEQCRLLITSKYSKELCKSVRKPRLRARTLQKSLKTSSSDEENDLTTTVLKGKVCASCCTRKTPMWRDAEDGTPLCNACGIRYKKYRVRCVNCWHIPRKESNSNSRCLKCGNFVRLTSAQRKHTT